MTPEEKELLQTEDAELQLQIEQRTVQKQKAQKAHDEILAEVKLQREKAAKDEELRRGVAEKKQVLQQLGSDIENLETDTAELKEEKNAFLRGEPYRKPEVHYEEDESGPDDHPHSGFEE